MRSALHKKFLPPFQSGSVDPLMVDLESYWTLDELSGTRNDSIGTNHLTDNNTVTYVNDGPRGVSAKIVAANSERLSTSGFTPELDFSTGASYGLWFKDTGNGANPWYFQYGTGAGANSILYSGGGTLRASFASGLPPVDIAGWSANEWHLGMITYDPVTKKYTLYLDGNSVLSGAEGADPVATNWEVFLGGIYGGACDELAANVFMWDRELSAPEVLELYNSGRGKRYADLSPGIKTNLVSYWNLDEVSNGAGAVTRVDSEGSNDLIDTNTVVSYDTGPEQVCANFVAASNESLSHVGIPITSEQAWSVVGWVKVSSNGVVFAIGDLISNLAYVYPGAGTTFYGSATPTFNNYPPVDGLWHMFAICQSGTTSKSSLDGGTFQTAANTPNAGSPYAVSINQSTDYADFVGGPFGIWNRALSQVEVTALFNSGVAKKYSELSASEKVDLISYWNLTELSGNRADSHGANTLTDNNTVLSVINMPDVADKICAKFVGASSESLTKAGFINPGTSWTISFWVNSLDDTNAAFIGFGIGTNLRISHQTDVYFVVNGNAVNRVMGMNGWHHILAWEDGANCYLSIDNDTAGSFVSSLPAGNATFYVGSNADNWYCTANIDELAIWTRVLTPAERTRLFNLGKGVFYPTFTP